MKLYIVADMEGVAGVVSFEQTEGNSADYETARQQYTEEVNSVCVGALEAGVEEIYINDFHGNGRNLIIEKLPPQAMVIRGGFRPQSGYDLLDDTFSGLVLLGAHSRTGSSKGLLPHTYSSKVSFEIFGQPVGEFDLLSLIAGEKKVPTILISGDSATIEQARTNLPSTNMVVTKYSIGTTGALCIHPYKVCDLLKEEIRRAVKAAKTIEPSQISPPAVLTVKLHDVLLSERLEWIPGLKRIDDTTFEFVGESMSQIADMVYGATILTE